MGGALGTTIATIFCNHNMTRDYFYVAAVCQIFLGIAAIFVDSEVDTNKFVSHTDTSMQQYEKKMKEQYPLRYRDRPVEAPNICVRIKFKLTATCKALRHPYVLKFLGFLALQGLTMPYFMAFDYVFAIDQLKIPLTLINLQGFFVGNLNFFVPWLY